MARVFEGSNFDILFAKAVAAVNGHPDCEASPRGQKVRELIAPTLVLADPRARLLANPARAANYGFGAGEFLWYWRGQNDLETMLYYNRRAAQFSDDGETVNSAYGDRIMKPWVPASRKFACQPHDVSQWEACKKTLLDDPDSRRALLIINNPGDNAIAAYEGSKDVPCTLSLQFFVRGRQLHLHTHMRSNDAFWGLTYDLFSFTLFQECMMLELRAAGMADLGLGNYYHTAGSLHIYERHFKQADAVAKAYVSKEFRAAAPMGPLDLGELALLAEQEEALRTRKVDQIGEAQFGSGVRWLAVQLNAHRRKRDEERGRPVGPGDSDRAPLVGPGAGDGQPGLPPLAGPAVR